MNDTSTKELIAYTQEEYKYARSKMHEIFFAEYKNIYIYHQYLQCLTPQSYQQFSNLPQGLSAPEST